MLLGVLSWPNTSMQVWKNVLNNKELSYEAISIILNLYFIPLVVLDNFDYNSFRKSRKQAFDSQSSQRISEYVSSRAIMCNCIPTILYLLLLLLFIILVLHPMLMRIMYQSRTALLSDRSIHTVTDSVREFFHTNLDVLPEGNTVFAQWYSNVVTLEFSLLNAGNDRFGNKRTKS